MSDGRKVLVVGASGRQGGAVAPKLLEVGTSVRALLRRLDSPAAYELQRSGVELMRGDLLDRDSLVRAMRGTQAVFAVTTPFEGGPEQEVLQGRTVAAAAIEAEVPHVVYSSVGSTDRNTAIPHFESKFAVEQELWRSGVPTIVIGPTTFFENLLAPWQLPSLQQGVISAGFLPDRNVQQVAVEDIASFAVHVLEDPRRFEGRRVDIASDALSGAEQAEILSRVIGREFRYEQQPVEQIRAYAGEDMVAMVEWMNDRGYDVDLNGLHSEFPEVGWQTFERWAEAQDWSILDARMEASWSR